MDLQDIQAAIGKVELTKTQQERAVTLYTHLCEAIQKTGENVDFYPQGSFSLRTAVRPYKKDKDKSYDVDVICEFSDYSKENITARQLMNILVVAVRSIAKEKQLKIEEFNRCVTVKYKEQNGIAFCIDLIPAVHESKSKILELQSKTERNDLLYMAIAIAGYVNVNYTWITNNPQGYKEWFNSTLQRFEKKVFEVRGLHEDGIASLPDDSQPTNMLKNVIKFLKRSQTVFYSRSKATTSSPSVIITTIVAKLSSNLIGCNNELELIREIVKQLMYLKKVFESRSHEEMFLRQAISQFISNDMGHWRLLNPADGGDNILSSWNENMKAANEFFNWLDSLNRLLTVFDSQKMSDNDKFIELREGLAVGQLPEFKAQHNFNGLYTHPWREL